MGWLGKKSINIASAKFTEYCLNYPNEKSAIRLSIADQLGNLVGLFDLNLSDYSNNAEGKVELLMDIAGKIPTEEAKKMANVNIDAGEKLEQKTGSSAHFHAYAIFGAYYQAIAEANILKNQRKSSTKQVRDMIPLLNISKQLASVIHNS